MNNILIAFNSNPDDPNHSFFQSCADEARQMCVNTGISFSSITGNKLTEQAVVSAMDDNAICVFATHGTPDSIVGESDNDIISTKTTNYVFKGKGLYAISCWCAQNLMSELLRIGLSFFVGYYDEISFAGDESIFVDCALSGLRSFVSGKSFEESKADMLSSFDEAIKNAEVSSNPFEKMFLLHDKESLVFSGEPGLLFSELS